MGNKTENSMHCDFIDKEYNNIRVLDINCNPQVRKSYFVKVSFQSDDFFRECYIVGKSKDSKWLIFQEENGNIEQHNIENGAFTFKHIDHSANN